VDDSDVRISNLPNCYSHGNRVHDAPRRCLDHSLVLDGDG